MNNSHSYVVSNCFRDFFHNFCDILDNFFEIFNIFYNILSKIENYNQNYTKKKNLTGRKTENEAWKLILTYSLVSGFYKP